MNNRHFGKTANLFTLWFLLCLFIVVWLIRLIHSGSIGASLSLVIMTIAVFFMVIRDVQTHDRLDLFSPWMLFPIYFFIIFAVGSVRWIIEGEANITKLATLSSMGILSYYLGTILTPSPKRTNRFYEWSDVRLITVVAVLSAISVTAAILFFYRVGVPIFAENLLGGRTYIYEQGTNKLLFIARLIAPAAILLVVRAATTRISLLSVIGCPTRSLRSSLTITVLMFAVIFMFSTAARADIFFVVFMSTIAYYETRKPYPKNGRSVLFIVFLFLLILAYGFVRVWISYPERLHEFALMASDYGFPDSVLGYYLLYVTLQISVYAHNLLLIFDWVPDGLAHQHGRVFLLTLSTLLPGRQDTIGVVLKEKIGLVFSGGGMNPTIIGELYIDFGEPHVVLAMFFYGCLSKYLYVRMKRVQSETALLFYSYWVFCLVASTTGGLFSQLSRWWYLLVFVLSVTVIMGQAKKYGYGPKKMYPRNSWESLNS